MSAYRRERRNKRKRRRRRKRTQGQLKLRTRRSSSSSAIVEWARRVTDKVGRPLDNWAVAATLEAEGMRDLDARERFGHDTLFDFADNVWTRAKKFRDSAPPPAVALPARGLRVLLKHLFLGSFFAMPMVGQIVVLLLTRYSLWASLDFSEGQATVIGIGTISSYLITGGIVMSIGRQGTAYRSSALFTMLRGLCGHLVGIGVVLMCAALLLVLAVQLMAPFMGGGAFAIMLLYFIALSLLWLTLAILYMLELHHWTVCITVAGALLVGVLIRFVGLHVYSAQLIAISLTVIAAFLIAWRRLDALVAQEDATKIKGLPTPPDVLAGILFPFAMYGLCYFTLLFLDRLFAWTASEELQPEPVWFQTAYEVGLDWALCSLLVPMTYLEHIVHEFSKRVQHEQRRYSLHQVAEHRASMRRFFGYSLTILLTLSVISVIATYWLIIWLQSFESLREPLRFFNHPIVRTVYWPAGIGYQLLTVGLSVALVLFTIQRGLMVLRVILHAVLVAAVVGFLASRLLAAHWAVLGFVAGTLVFAVWMLVMGNRVYGKMDFYYGSAY